MNMDYGFSVSDGDFESAPSEAETEQNEITDGGNASAPSVSGGDVASPAGSDNTVSVSGGDVAGSDGALTVSGGNTGENITGTEVPADFAVALERLEHVNYLLSALLFFTVFVWAENRIRAIVRKVVSHDGNH